MIYPDEHFTLITQEGKDFEVLPDDSDIALWYYKGDGCPPYCGGLCDDDFPGTEFFFCWCPCPSPSLEFGYKYSVELPDSIPESENWQL